MFFNRGLRNSKSFSCKPVYSNSRMFSTTPAGPLSGIKVLDMSRVLAAPYCSMVLGDMGAEIYKIEHPIQGDETRTWGPPFTQKGGESAYFLSINRNKKSITLDLKKEEAKEIIKDFARVCDVAIENFPPGKADNLGVGYNTLSAVNPKLVYASLTGFGPDGPYKDRLAYDVIVSGVGGFLAMTGPEGGEPVKCGVAITDITAGLFCHGAIAAALFARERTGKGQKIDVSLLESQVATLANIGSNYLIGGKEAKRMGTAHASIVPYQAFKTKDGEMIVGALNDQQFIRLCGALNRTDLANNPLYKTNPDRVANRLTLITILAEEMLKKTTSEWQTLLDGVHVPSGPINNMSQVFSDPQVLHRNMLVSVDHPTAGEIKMAGIPVKYSETKPSIRLPPPVLGQHTEEVLREVLGYDSDKIKNLAKKGVIGKLE